MQFRLAALSFCLCAISAAQPPVAKRFLETFGQLRMAEALPAAHRPQVKGQFTDAEINQYMQYALAATPRPGLDSINVKMFPQNYVSTYAMLDFDAVERWRPGTIPTLLRPVLSGKKSVWVDVRFKADNGFVTFSVEKARYNDIWLPAYFVEKMIGIVAARQPEHYDTSKPVPIPFSLRRLWTSDHLVGFEN